MTPVDAQNQIGFAQLGIGSVPSQHSLIVPPNQREYSWTEREITGLFTDISRAINEGAQEYFLGTVVTIPKRLGVLEVVDGQQRLATTAILMAAIRDALAGRDADQLIVERIENTFLSAIDPYARERVSRLRLNLSDASFFDRYVLRRDGAQATSRSHRLIKDATDFAREHVAQVLGAYTPKDHGDVLNRWVEFIEHRAIVILLKVPGESNAYKMFETLNDRGLRTSQADLVKNYLFGQSDPRLPEAQQKWASMKALLEAIGEDDELTINFLRQLLISFYGHLKDADVYEQVQKHSKGTSLSLQMLTRLETGAADYAALLNADHETWNEYPATTRRAVKTLLVLRSPKPMRPLMLAIVRGLSEKETDKAFRLLVSLSVRYLIVGGMRTGTVEETLAAAAHNLSEGKITTAVELAQFLQKVTPNDSRFVESFKIATVSGPHFARYYLRSLEMANKQEPDPYFVPNDDQSIITLEHILPERPQDNWPQFSPEAHSAFCRRIGNMALLKAKKNSDLHSAPFSAKRQTYAETPYEWTRQLAELDDWTVAEINNRQEKMAAVAPKIWPISVK